jgi:RNA polymerase sigma-B factor
LVERLARRFDRGGVARDDLVQAGAVGLILAVDRFDAQRGVPFVAFAIPTIVGSIQRYVRDVAPIVRTPRPRYSDAPAESEAQRVERPSHTTRRSDVAHVTLLGNWQDLEATVSRIAHRDLTLENVPERLTVEHSVHSLGPRDRQIIYLRFYQDESLTQIADQVGLSVSRVSRLLTRALATLRDELEPPEETR